MRPCCSAILPHKFSDLGCVSVSACFLEFFNVGSEEVEGDFGEWLLRQYRHIPCSLAIALTLEDVIPYLLAMASTLYVILISAPSMYSFTILCFVIGGRFLRYGIRTSDKTTLDALVLVCYPL